MDERLGKAVGSALALLLVFIDKLPTGSGQRAEAINITRNLAEAAGVSFDELWSKSREGPPNS